VQTALVDGEILRGKFNSKIEVYKRLVNGLRLEAASNVSAAGIVSFEVDGALPAEGHIGQALLRFNLLRDDLRIDVLGAQALCGITFFSLNQPRPIGQVSRLRGTRERGADDSKRDKLVLHIGATISQFEVESDDLWMHLFARDL
jgi:hypothetical protein